MRTPQDVERGLVAPETLGLESRVEIREAASAMLEELPVGTGRLIEVTTSAVTPATRLARASVTPLAGPSVRIPAACRPAVRVIQSMRANATPAAHPAAVNPTVNSSPSTRTPWAARPTTGPREGAVALLKITVPPKAYGCRCSGTRAPDTIGSAGEGDGP